MIDLILKTHGLDVRVYCKPSEGTTVNTTSETLNLLTKLLDTLHFYEKISITINNESFEALPSNDESLDDLYKVHEDNMMRVYNELRTTS